MVADGNIPPAGEGVGSPRMHEPAPFAEAVQNAGAAWASAQIYLMAQADRLKLAARTVILLAIAGILAVLFVAAAFVTAAVLLLAGAADGLAALLGGRQWAGDLITGGAVVLGTVVAGYIVVSRMTKASRLATMARYQSSKISN